MENEKKLDFRQYHDENDNPGLDADHSSDGATANSLLNDDNDRVSGHPDGESDDVDGEDSGIYSPLEDK